MKTKFKRVTRMVKGTSSRFSRLAPHAKVTINATITGMDTYQRVAVLNLGEVGVLIRALELFSFANEKTGGHFSHEPLQASLTELLKEQA